MGVSDRASARPCRYPGGGRSPTGRGHHRPGTATRHLITTVAVRVDDADRATADSYFVFLQNTTTSPTIFNMGAYHDTFVRQGDAWQLARREITLG